MTTIAITVCLLLVVLAAVQLLPTIGFVRVLRRAAPSQLSDQDCPKAAVLLSVRGPDPFLAESVEKLLNQDYPNYDVRIVVDHRDDPAWEVIQGVVQRLPAKNVRVEPLTERLGTCALKANSLLQAIAGLDDSYEVIAVLDSDTVPHRTWLRELVAPLRDPQVGVASGNRWYMPRNPTLGSLVRYNWNAAAVVQMYWNQFTWGGSIAIRGTLVRESELQDRWRKAIAEDTAVYGVVKNHGLRAAFVPSLMIVNRESCSLGEFYSWVRRQLLVGRLQHGGWPMVFLHGASTSIVLLVAVVLLLLAILQQQWQAAGFLAGGLASYALVMLAGLGLLEAAVRRTVRQRNEPTRWMSLGTFAKLLLTLPLTQILYASALPTIRFMREVTWRGVRYQIDGPWNVRLITYQPFSAKDRRADSTVSL